MGVEQDTSWPDGINCSHQTDWKKKNTLSPTHCLKKIKKQNRKMGMFTLRRQLTVSSTTGRHYCTANRSWLSLR